MPHTHLRLEVYTDGRPLLKPYRLFFVCVIALLAHVGDRNVCAQQTGRLAESTTVPSQTDNLQLVQWIDQLGSESYVRRKNAYRNLFVEAMRDSASLQRVRSTLEGYEAESTLTVSDQERSRSVDWLLEELQQEWLEINLQAFKAQRPFSETLLGPWPAFSRAVGDRIRTRQLYAQLLQRYPQIVDGIDLGLLDSMEDIDRLRRDDAVGWAAHLFVHAQLNRQVRTEPRTAARSDRARQAAAKMTAILHCNGSGPNVESGQMEPVLTDLVQAFVTDAGVDVRERLVIASRFGCHDLVQRDCQLVLNDPTQSPARIVNALLIASTVDDDQERVDQWLGRFLGDSRVSHAWRSSLRPEAPRRTQIRDVALALAMHRSGLDPREHGFKLLVSDPVLIFRPYSLGFDSEQSRQQAHSGFQLAVSGKAASQAVGIYPSAVEK